MTVTSTASANAQLTWVSRLHRYGSLPALITAERTVTYADLAGRVDELAAQLSGERRLALVAAAATPDSVVSYLAALAAGHVVLMVAPGSGGPADQLRADYDPDIVLNADGSVEVVRAGPAHDLHPELALLLSTSGSTGSSKLVRLSAANLEANTAQIAAFLQVRTDDCAALTLPLSYCYGLSVLQTHLANGASILLTDLSVVDECFWDLFERTGATTFPGVPRTFELLERSGFADRHLPRLRYVTQAGGSMPPGQVRRWAELGQEHGWDLVIMYGQSEATARMAYLPPHLALEHPSTVGVPVPGGSISIVDGEIVFDGPNVMLGYAHGPADLALGRTVQALHTGDLGQITPEGLLQVTGRRARFVKVLGHRVDLDTLEGVLRSQGHDVRCAGTDDLVLASARGVTSAPARESVRRAVVAACGAPRHAVRVVIVDDHPLLGTGKPDYAGILALGPSATLAAGSSGTSVAQLYAALLHRSDVGDRSTFTGLGGDSLSYVEVSIRLEELLGGLPAGWHLMTVGELDRLRTPVPSQGDGRLPIECDSSASGGDRQRGRKGCGHPPIWRDMESSVWLRALAILLIVGTHARLFTLQGSANALLVIAGYQLARFQLSVPGRRERVAGIGGAGLRIVGPTLVAIAAAHLLDGSYQTRNFFLANWLAGEPQLGPAWRFWFIEALVWGIALTAALTAVPAFRRLERRFPLGAPFALMVGAFVLFRLPLLPLPVPHMHGSAHVVLYLFLLGWGLARASSLRHRVLLTVVVIASIGTFSFNPYRDGLTIALVLALLWLPVTKVPAMLVPVIRPLAASSLYIYVVHWQAVEVLSGQPIVAFAGSLAVGLVYWWAWTRGAVIVRRRLPRIKRDASRPASTPRPG